MKKSIPLETSTQSQVLELLGRALYMCNVVELRIRWMYKCKGGIWKGATPILQEFLKVAEKELNTFFRK